jgi:GTP-binding protein EngB required for normal cell division
MQDIPDKDIHARYALLCRATSSQYNGDMAVAAQLDKLQTLLQQDLRELARHGSPDDFADLYFELEQELVRFRQCCAFPALANKTVVAFGGAFSAGKSSLINALLSDKLLVTEVDPTTSLPTYLLKGEQDAIAALNLFGHAITLSRDEFLSLTHDEVTLYGSNISQLLQAAMITRRDFPWQNLAFIDTPGYTKHDDSRGSARTDEQLARSQLNAAQAIVWVISAKDGGIKEDDIQFLASLEPTIPRLVLVSRADQVPEADIDRIVETIKQRLQERNLAPLAVLSVSSRKPERFSQQAILEQLQLWNASPKLVSFANHFRRQFLRYNDDLDQRLRKAHLELNRLNKLLAAVDVSAHLQQQMEALSAHSLHTLQHVLNQQSMLSELQTRFLATLQGIVMQLGLAWVESEEQMLREEAPFNLLSALRQRKQRQDPADFLYLLSRLSEPGLAQGIFRLMDSPLPSHIVCSMDAHSREIYAVGLTMLLAGTAGISDIQSRMHSVLLSSMDLNTRQDSLFQRIRNDGATLLSELASVLSEQALPAAFLLDAIIICCNTTPLSEHHYALLSELIDFIGLEPQTVETVVDLALLVFGQHHDKTIDTSFDYQKTRHWIPFFYRKLTAERLVSKSIAGYWYVDEPLIVNSKWMLKNAVIQFRNQASILTHARGETSIVASKLSQPLLSFTHPKGHFLVIDSQLHGLYPEEGKYTSIVLKGGNEMSHCTFRNVRFNTVNARAVLLDTVPAVIDSCEFVACGNRYLHGGAIAAFSRPRDRD